MNPSLGTPQSQPSEHLLPQPRANDFRRPPCIRLTRSYEFDAVRSQGRRAHGRLMILSVLRAPVEPHAESKVGIIVSRKVGGAVVRNRLKRRCKELHRLSRSYIACGLWIVMILKREAATSSFADLQTEWLRLARKLSILTRS